MNILIGSSSPIDQGSGVNTYVKEISLEIRSRGHRVTIYAPEPEDNTWLTENDIELWGIDRQAPVDREACSLINRIKLSKLDLIINNDNPYLQSIVPAIKGIFVSVMHLGVRNIAALAVHNSAWVDHIVCISNDMRYRVMSKYSLGSEKVPLIYNGIKDPCSEGYRIAPVKDCMRVVYSGGSNRRKGFDLLRRAIISDPKCWDRIHLDIYGEIDNVTSAELKSYDFVTLHGKVDRVKMLGALQRANVFLLPSREEGCPMALIEAMAHGLVPIVSDGEGAMDNMITSGKNGFVCQIENWPTQMMACLLKLRENESIVKKLASRSRETFLKNYSVVDTVDRLLDLAEQPLSSKPPAPYTIRFLKWHRPTIRGLRHASLIERLFVRIGYLQKSSYSWKPESLSE